jgi:hypothetical protein
MIFKLLTIITTIKKIAKLQKSLLQSIEQANLAQKPI